MRRLHPHWNVTVLCDSNLPPVGERPDIAALSAEHRADWMRLRAVSEHGGVWLDAACLLFRPVTCWVELDADWDMQGFATPWDDSVMENWAFAAPSESPLMRDWFREYDHAVRMGCAAYCEELRARHPPGFPRILFNHLPYLTQHATLAVVRLKHHQAKIRLQPSGTGPFAIQTLLNWIQWLQCTPASAGPRIRQRSPT
jgi:hypothetical protein